jgi:ankyrin repeat protein
VILDAQPDIINIANDRLKTPLHLACTSTFSRHFGQHQCVARTCVTLASFAALMMHHPVGNAKVVALLLEDRRGAVTDMQDINGDTALHFAASHNHLKVLMASSLTPHTQSFRHQLTRAGGRYHCRS